MPFSTDECWPRGLLNAFHVGRNQNMPFESRYYGPYSLLLHYALMDDFFNFVISLQTAPHERSPRDAVDITVYLLVLDRELNPVLFVEINDDSWAHGSNTRLAADGQMRQRYDQLLFQCPIPQLYGLSLLGTSLRIYCGEKATNNLTPNFVDRPDPRRVLPPDFLEGEWDLDILSPDGLKKMQDIVEYVKVESAKALGQ